MFNRKNKNRKTKDRFARGAIIAEHASVLYVLFFLLFFPLMDLAAMGLRTFLLWYACNQAAMAGSKGSQWSTGTATGQSAGATYYTSMQTQATNALTQVVNSYQGITVNGGYPVLSVVLTAIDHSDVANNPADVASIPPLTGAALPLTAASTPPIVDTAQYAPFFRVTVQGTIQPFMIVPFFFSVPGLTGPFQVTITADQLIENAAALNS